MNEKKSPKFCKCFLCVCLAVFIALAPLLLARPKNTASASTDQTESGAFVMTFDITFSGVWSSSFNSTATSVYTNNISPTTLQLHFFRGTWVKYTATTYSTGGKNSYNMNAYTYASTYTDLVTSSTDTELYPPVTFIDGYWDTGWISMASTNSSMANELHNPMRIRFSNTFLNESSDDFIDCVRFSSNTEFISGGYRLINSMFFYSKTGTCRVDLMQYWPTNSGPSFNAFTDNTFYFQEYVDLVSIRSFQQGYDEGYELGFDNGLDEGLDQGYDLGFADGSSDKITAGGFFESVFDILDVKIFGVLSISDLMVMLLSVWLVLTVLKIFAGG